MVPRILTILETITTFLIGALIGSMLLSVAGLTGWMNETDLILINIPVNFHSLAFREVVGSIFKYGSIFILIIAILIIRKEPDYKSFLGLKSPSLSLVSYLKAVLLIVAVGGFLPKLLFLLRYHQYVDGGPAHWDLFYEPWNRGFWMFMLAGSIIIPPIVEEIFFRGYMQGRLHQVFRPGTAILVTAIIFTLFHTQYLLPDYLSIGLLCSLFISAVILSYARYWTGSIIPGMAAHALVNIPLSGVIGVIWIAATLVIIVLWSKDIKRHLHHLVSLRS